MNNTTWFTYIMEEKRIIHSICSIDDGYRIQVDDCGLRLLIGLSEDSCFYINEKKLAQEILGNSYVYFITDDFHCNYIIMRNDKNTLLIIGPYLLGSHSYVDTERIRKKNKLPKTDSSTLSQYYARLPQISDISLWESMVRAYCTERFGVDGYTFKAYDVHSEDTTRGWESKPVETTARTILELEKIYAHENRFMEALSVGDEEKAVECLRSISRHDMERRTYNFIRDIKNMYIVFNTLCRTAVSRSNVHPMVIDRLSREFSIRIERMTDVQSLMGIRKEMVVRYCSAVRESISTDNPTIKRIVVYIDSQLENQLNLKDAAAQFGISREYLSRAFKKETGRSFTEYIHYKRMNKAKDMLEHTYLSISEIAQLCGYTDYNYFSRKFKLLNGITPTEYRGSII